MTPGLLRRYRDPLIAVLLLALPLVVYLSNRKNPRDYNTFDRGVVWVSAPIQWVVVSTLEGIRDAWRRYVALMGVQEQNEDYRRQIAELTSELARHREAKMENERLRLLLALRDRSAEIQPITARVIATSPTPLFRSVRIGRGTSDGVGVGSAVVSYQGVVGRVAAASAAWADVMLIVDANSSTDVLIQRNRARARVRGTGGDSELGIRVEYLARTEDVQPGDVLITSGVGSVFPKGLPVGRVASVEQAAFGLYQNAVVLPAVDFRRLEEIMVIPQGFPTDTSYEVDPVLESPRVEVSSEVEEEATANSPDSVGDTEAAGEEPTAPESGTDELPGPESG